MKNIYTLLFFLSPTCPVCKKLVPVLRSIRSAERKWLDIILASDGEKLKHARFIEIADLQTLGRRFQRQLAMLGREPRDAQVVAAQHPRRVDLDVHRLTAGLDDCPLRHGAADDQQHGEWRRCCAGTVGPGLQPKGSLKDTPHRNNVFRRIE